MLGFWRRWELHLFQHKRGPLTALVAAFVLVLQSSLTLWATAVAPTDPMVDSWGNVLCITGMDENGDDPASDHSGMFDCCTLGCGVSAMALAAPSDASIALLPLPVRSEPQRAARQSAAIQSPDHDPGSPRAPPLTA